MTTQIRIEITNPNKTGDSSGFVDFYPVEQYGVLTTKEEAITKTRGIIRYQNIIDSLRDEVSYYEISKLAHGATATTEATKVTLILDVRGVESLEITTDTGTLTALDAIKYLVAQAMTLEHTKLRAYYDPEKIAETKYLNVGSLGTLAECLALVSVN